MQQFGVIGLSVMGKNLALNVRNHGFSVSGFSIDKPEVDALAKYEDDKLKPCYTWEEFVDSLIQQMPEGRQRIYKLSRQSHLSNREIADQLQISENTVESQLTKAISFLRKRLKDQYDLGLLALSCLLNS